MNSKKVSGSPVIFPNYPNHDWQEQSKKSLQSPTFQRIRPDVRLQLMHRVQKLVSSIFFFEYSTIFFSLVLNRGSIPPCGLSRLCDV
jgi:hypothetical protein